MYNNGLGRDQGRVWRPLFMPKADVAQLVEQLIRNEKVGGSTPLIGTKRIKHLRQSFEVGVFVGVMPAFPLHRFAFRSGTHNFS